MPFYCPSQLSTPLHSFSLHRRLHVGVRIAGYADAAKTPVVAPGGRSMLPPTPPAAPPSAASRFGNRQFGLRLPAADNQPPYSLPSLTNPGVRRQGQLLIPPVGLWRARFGRRFEVACRCGRKSVVLRRRASGPSARSLDVRQYHTPPKWLHSPPCRIFGRLPAWNQVLDLVAAGPVRELFVEGLRQKAGVVRRTQGWSKGPWTLWGNPMFSNVPERIARD